MIKKKTCLVCGVECSETYCLDCLSKIHDLIDPKIKDFNNSNFDFLIYCTNYLKIKKYFKLMKYEKRLDLIEFFINCLTFKLSISKKSVITYIPSNMKNRFNKGYDFSEEIAKKFAELNNIPMYKLIKNNLFSKESKSMSKKDRLSISEQKLSIDERSVSELDIQVIYVFDDVYTTGSTMNKACELLADKYPGANIVAVCLAKSSSPICYLNQLDVN
ncbi:hypothetical protein CL656_00300 [bacterium]|nr:hypothetical protein [bacterium]|tara:strand:+ start:1221 stop:1871 length:651 start_codon:yes stop_codon:yes gene_type:complete